MAETHTEHRHTNRVLIIGAACVIMFFSSSIALYSIIQQAITAIHPEWEKSLAYAFPMFQTAMAVTGIFAGRISDKFGPRNVVFVAGISYGLGFGLSGFITTPWQFHLTFSLLGGIGNGLAYTPALTTGQRWFPDKRGTIAGITLAAATLGPAALSPFLSSLLIPHLGIFNALKFLGVLFFITISVPALFMRKPADGWLPEGYTPPQTATGSVTAGVYGDLGPGAMIKTGQFWLMVVTFAFAAIAGTMMVGNMSTIGGLQIFGDPKLTAAVAFSGTIVMTNTIANFFGRLCFGWLIDRIGGFKALLGMLVITTAALLLMTVSHSQALFLFSVALFGFSFGALMVIYPPLTSSQFGTTNSGVNYGIMFLGYATSTWIQSLLVATFHDPTAGQKAYQPVFHAAIAIMIVAFVLVLIMMRNETREKARA
ncbi:hypothetical protein ACU19_04070 [Actinobaculum suis]|uniref:MFS transporter n=1 Tax=Actinobaculum suis TaxID=1657 RepID=UPI00066FF898|nr:MFS transporter [Actinobaculum suis]KMY23446.1 hypothetical protein ACU19_04070 [Actinobaculum suis]